MGPNQVIAGVGWPDVAGVPNLLSLLVMPATWCNGPRGVDLTTTQV